MSEGHKIQPLPDAKRSIFLSLIYESGKLIMLFAMQITNVGVYRIRELFGYFFLIGPLNFDQ